MAQQQSDWVPSELQVQRLGYRNAQARRSRLIAGGSSVIVLAALVVAVGGSSGWPVVRRSFLNWDKAVSAFPDVLVGLWLNIRVMIVCAVLVFFLGLLLAIMRTLQGPVFLPLRLLAAAYTDVFRGLPLILVLYVLGFGVPGLALAGLPTQPVFYGCAALVLTYSAYVAEVMRAGIESVHPSQRAAARSLGLSNAQTLRFVVLPQAGRRVLPPLLNDLVSLQKDSGLIAVLGVVDAIRAAQISTANDFNFTPYLVAGLLFVCLTIPLTRWTDWIARRQGWYGVGGSRI